MRLLIITLLILVVSCDSEMPTYETPENAVGNVMTGDISERKHFNGYEIQQALVKLGWHREWNKLDFEYLAYSMGELLWYMVLDDLNTKDYHKYFDCDNFTGSFIGHIKQVMEGIAIGEICFDRHMAVIFYDTYKKQIWIIDPQDDSFIPLDSVKEVWWITL